MSHLDEVEASIVDVSSCGHSWESPGVELSSSSLMGETFDELTAKVNNHELMSCLCRTSVLAL